MERYSDMNRYDGNVSHLPRPEVSPANAKEETPQQNDRLNAIYEKLLYVLEQKKIYLDAHINLVKLSQLLCTNTTYLSRVINQHFHCNLKTLLNRYRVNYAKQLLTRKKCVIMTLPAQCGFISRSTFYAAFTKFEHITPADYRTQHRSKELLETMYDDKQS